MEMKTMSDQELALYNGAELTAESFQNFVKRLQFHCKGKGVEWHCTADAVFLVQHKSRIVGIDPQFGAEKCIIDEHSETYFTMADFVESLDEEMLGHYGLDDFGEDISFLEMSEGDQWDALEAVGDLTITGYSENWETINFHFTKEAAERFIERKKHDYRLGMRVYADAQTYCWEFNAIKEALMNGKLVFNDKA